MAWLNRFCAMAIKDLRLILRNRTLVLLLLAYPWFIICISPRLINYSLKEFKVVIIDNDRSELSMMVGQSIGHSRQVSLVSTCNTLPEAMDFIEAGKANCVIEVPAGCEKNLLRFGAKGAVDTRISVTANAVNISSAITGVQVVVELLQRCLKQFAEQSGTRLSAGSEFISIRNLFNPLLSYLIFMLPAVLMSLVTILGGNITGTNIINDRNNGTDELVNVSPVTRSEVVLSQTLVCYLVGVAELLFINLMYYFIYDFSPKGSALGVFIIFSLFLLWTILFTIWIGNISARPIHVILTTTIVLTIAQQLSGFETPIESMKEWMQWTTWTSPARYLISGLRAAYLKGAAFGEILVPVGALSAFAALTYLLAVKTYNKTSV